MAYSRYKHFETVWNEDINHTQKGTLSNEFKTSLYNLVYSNYLIPLKYKYRPDLIAKEFYGDSKLYWILVYYNRFNNSPFDFEANTYIKIPPFQDVLNII